MKRLQFIKTLFGVATVATVPSIAVAKKDIKTYSHDDIFHKPFNNKILVYFKSESDIYMMIKESMGDRIVDKDRFRCYLPKHAFTLLRKKEYTIEDFKPLIAMLHGYYEQNNLYSSAEHGVFMRMIYQKENDSYYPDLFLAK